MLRPRHLPLPEYHSLLTGMRTYWLCFGLFIALGIAFLLRLPGGQEIFWINAHRSPALDAFFRLATRLGEEWAYVGMVVVLLFFRYKAILGLPLLGATVTVVAGAAKSWFAHDRPFPFFNKLGLWEQLRPVDGVDLLEGATSFPSGHTMSAFALYTFAALNLPRKNWVSLSLLAIAVATGLSRMYLLQHFLKDVIAGALIGVVLATAWHLILLYLWKEKQPFQA